MSAHEHQADARRDRVARAGKWAGGRVAAALDKAIGPRAEGTFGILMYHRVTEEPGDDRPTVNVPPDRFRRQLHGLLERGYRIWSLGEALDAAATATTYPSKVAVITFDDGYESVYRNAWPALRELRAPATVLVTTAYLETEQPFPFDEWASRRWASVEAETWRPLRWQQCAEMENDGIIEIGSHSHTHGDFRGKPDAFAEDVRASIAALDARLGARRRPFAFPFGSVSRGFADPALQHEARTAGFTCALTTEIGLVKPGASPFAWPRVEVDRTDDAASIQAKLDGWYSWMNVARRTFWSGRRLLRRGRQVLRV